MLDWDLVAVLRRNKDDESHHLNSLALRQHTVTTDISHVSRN